MRELAWENAAAYLHETGRVPAGQSIRVRELSGGVSNVVLRVDLEDRPSFVIKQCRERLRVAMDWRAAGPDLDGQRCARRSTAVCGFDPPVLGRLPGADRNGPVVAGGPGATRDRPRGGVRSGPRRWQEPRRVSRSGRARAGAPAGPRVLKAVNNVTSVMAPAVIGSELDISALSTQSCSRSTARRTKAAWAPMRSWESRWPSRVPRPPRGAKSC